MFCPIHIITAASRGTALVAGMSIDCYLDRFPHEWHLKWDNDNYPRPGFSSKVHISATSHYGKPVLNDILDDLRTNGQWGMVAVLDDDTVFHPGMADAFSEFFAHHYPAKKAFTVRTIKKNGTVLVNVRENPNVIDQGSYVIHTDLIGNTRFFAEAGADARRFHDADGEFYREIRGRSEDQWVDLPIVGSIWNALRFD